MADTQISEAEVVEGTAVERYEPPTPPASLFGTTDPVEVVQRAAEIAGALKDVIIQRDLYQNIQGKSHVKVEGWQLLGSMLGVTAVCVATEPVENGWKATVEARTADGRVIGRADALCTKDERRWKTADDYARLSMAQTRATSKALKGPLGFVISMAGYQTTPAEEMPSEPQRSEPHPPEPQPPERASAEQQAQINTAADEAGVPPSVLGNIIRLAAGADTEMWETEDDAAVWVARALPRLPAGLVPVVLSNIAKEQA